VYHYINYPRYRQLQESLLKLIHCSNPGINAIDLCSEKNTEVELLYDYFAINQYIQRTDLLRIEPDIDSYAHTDSGNFRYSLNIPVVNYEGTMTKFYKPNNKPIIVRNADLVTTKEKNTKYGVFFRFLIDEKSKLLGEFETKSIFLMDTQIPHMIYNPNSVSRYTMLIRLNKNFIPGDKFKLSSS
jgi:hypothetical protein